MSQSVFQPIGTQEGAGQTGRWARRWGGGGGGGRRRGASRPRARRWEIVDAARDRPPLSSSPAASSRFPSPSPPPLLRHTLHLIRFPSFSLPATGQKRLTNVAVVRLKRNGKRFEVACYKNKVLNWRSGVETDLDEVLQSTVVYSNVSRAKFAASEDLMAAFGTTDHEAVCVRILREGELQVSDRERKVETEARFRDVAAALAERCVNPLTGKPHTIPVLERALRDAHFAADPRRSAKAQASEALEALAGRIPIERAAMRVRVSVGDPNRSRETLDFLRARGAAVERAELGEDGALAATALIVPGLYRELAELLGIGAKRVAGSGAGNSIQVLELAAGVAAAAGASKADAGDAKEAGAGAGATTAASAGAAAAVPSPAVAPGVISLDPLSTTARDLGAALEAPAVAEPRTARPSAPLGRASRPAPRAAPLASHLPPAYPRGPIAQLPESLGSRRARFLEIDDLEPGWTVEVGSRPDGEVADAVFFSPDGERVGAFAAARRRALAAKKARG